MAKEKDIKHYRQSGETKFPTTLPYSEIAVAKDGSMVVGDENDNPVKVGVTDIVTTTEDGLMSSADKTKLNGVEEGANAYTHPASHPATMITEDATHKFVTDAEKTKWNNPTTSIMETVPISLGELISAYDIVDVINGEAKKTVISELGTAQIFESANSMYVSAVALSDSKVLIAYQDVGNSSKGTAIVGTISGTVVTFGTQYIFETTSTKHISAVALSDSKVLIAYKDNDNYDTAIVGTISGTTITFGTAQVFESTTSYYSATATALSYSKVLIAYRNSTNNDYGTAIVGTISGTTITFGSKKVFNATSTHYVSATTLTDSKVLIAYRNSTGYGAVIVGTISGTVPTFGSAQVFHSALIVDISAVALSDSKVLIAYQDVGNNDYGTSIVGTISGTVVTLGTAQIFESANSMYVSAVALSDSKVLIAYQDGGNNDYGTSIVGTISGTTITFGTAQIFEIAEVGHISAVALSDDFVLIAYQDVGNNYYGTVITQQVEIDQSKEVIVTAIDGINCDIIYSGIYADVSLTKGMEIKSTVAGSVRGYVPTDGKLAVQGYWERS